jgi:two-component sensor histidine kinase
MGVVAVLGSISYLFMRQSMKDLIEGQLRAESTVVEERLDVLLSTINLDVRSMAANHIIVNALIDSEGRETYVEPFLKSYEVAGRLPFILTLSDFEGKPLNSSASVPISYAGHPAMVRSLIEDEEPYAEVEMYAGVERLVVAFPVLYGATGRAEGMLVLEVPVDAILTYSSGRLMTRHPGALLSLQSHGRTVWSNATTPGGKLYSITTRLYLDTPLDTLGLSIEYGRKESVLFAPLTTLTAIYLAAAAVILLLTLALARWGSRRVTGPLTALTEAATGVTDFGQPESRIEVAGTDEVAVLGHAFNAMLERLRASHETLEERVRERTAELALLNADLTREVAVRTEAERGLTASLAEKEILIKEVHHRVKNNLAIITSLLSLQSRYITDEASLKVFQESQGRIKSMALVHEQLYRGRDFREINVKSYVEALVGKLHQTFSGGAEGVRVATHADEVPLGMDYLIPVGLIINELVTNSFKYAFAGMPSGLVDVSITRKGGTVTLCVADNGRGLPDGFDPATAESLGYRLVHALNSQLSGSMEIISESGTMVRFTFPLHEEEAGDEPAPAEAAERKSDAP